MSERAKVAHTATAWVREGPKAKRPRVWLYSFEVVGPGKKRTKYGLAYPCRDDKAARRHVKLWANDYHGEPNRVMFVDAREAGR